MSFGLFDYLLMFATNFAAVFLLGVQSRNVMAGRYTAAIITSIGISFANFAFVKYAAVGDALTFTVCALGGATGIASSIWFYENVMLKRFKKPSQTNVEGSPVRPSEQGGAQVARVIEELNRSSREALKRTTRIAESLESVK